VFEAIAAKEPARAQEAMSALIQLARIDTPTTQSARKRTTR
jgi:hypothetical protein